MRTPSLFNQDVGSAVCALILAPGAAVVVAAALGISVGDFVPSDEGGTTAEALALTVARGVAQGPITQTVWDGVYTIEQAKRGEQTFKRACGYCHRDDLSGDGDVGAPALVGSGFSYRWRGMAVAEMFFTIGETMPQDDPASLTPQECLNIISYLLSMSDIPAGDVELPLDIGTLEKILFTEKAQAK